MTEQRFASVVIGAGAAGMAAALEVARAGHSVALIDREGHLGGILPQCIHNGFGLHEFREELTGPEFSGRLERAVREAGIPVFRFTTVTAIGAPEAPCAEKRVHAVSPSGVMSFLTRAVILAMGSRERNRGNVRIPGSRPAGIFTAGLAQRLVNIEGYIPGKRVVIIGSGDIGLIMARRLSWTGCEVKAVVEILSWPSGLPRNIAQCLDDFSIPLYLSSQTTCIYGTDRVEGVEVTPLENGALRPEKAFRIDCDTVLLSVGLIPENELSRAAGINLSPVTGGAVVDSDLMTNIPGVFACGNVLHIHDLVDYAVAEARFAGLRAADWLSFGGASTARREFDVKAGSNVRYVNPPKVDPDRANTLHMRALSVIENAVLRLSSGGTSIAEIRRGRIQPSEMLRLELGPRELGHLPDGSVLDVSLEGLPR